MSRADLRRAAPTLLVLLVVAVAALVAGYLTGGGEDPRPRPAALPAAQPVLRGVVQSLSGDQLALSTSDGPVTLPLSPSASVETLRPIPLSQVAPGDWLNVGAVDNQSTVWAIIGLTVIQQPQLAAPR